MRGTAALAGLAGVVVILHLPYAAGVRSSLAAVWLAWITADLVCLVRGQRNCVGVRVDAAGRVQIVTPDDCCIAATIGPGSVVTSRFVWLRLEAADGRCYRELVRGNCPRDSDWRRFQVILRHLGAGP